MASIKRTNKNKDNPVEQGVISLAEKLLKASIAERSVEETARSQQLAGMITDPVAKVVSMAMTDRLIRSSSSSRSAQAWRGILSRFGLPSGFGPKDKRLLEVGAMASRFFPPLVMSAVRARLLSDSRGVILPAEPELLAKYLEGRKSEGIRANVNRLGEAILGEEEASNRISALLELLARSDVDCISVKISSIYSQINLLAWDETLSELKSRLRKLYRSAIPGGKFVYLDMEEYRDLALTVAAFREVLDEQEFKDLRAGIVLQAYLPDSNEAQQELTRWAQQRVAAGGSKIKIRLVKGANLAMELVESELHGWNAAPYATKADTDANFRRMLEFACQSQHAAAVDLGVGTHNLFDVALALVLREKNKVQEAIEIEMLEGMANHQARAVCREAGGLLFYAPVVEKKDFGSALAYLIRRLDENTGPDNFLSDLFALTPGSEAWDRQMSRFKLGWKYRNDLSMASHRSGLPTPKPNVFENVPDSDWTQKSNREMLHRSLKTFRLSEAPAEVGIAGVSDLLTAAVAAQIEWEACGDSARANLLRRCGEVMASYRMETIAVLRDEGKKAVGEADAEVSEAIDFARYYATTGMALEGINSKALGVVVITPPWNFPFAIPCGGVMAALMAGNSVILKPAPDTVRSAWWLVQQLWEAGIPKDVLQFAVCPDSDASRGLVTDPRTAAVVLTGAYETASMFRNWRPDLQLFAETSGKNSIVVSAMADRDLAIKDLVRSAFGHAGQKCSAASLAILEAEVYDDPTFRRQLRDAAASLHVGPSSDLRSIVTPIMSRASCTTPDTNLHRALTTLELGEKWLLEPRQDPHDPCLWSPGIRLNVKRGSWFHQTECFGPVLGLMRAANLRQAVEYQNSVSYGLTAGLQSLDESEIATWSQRVQAGNLYINRSITGAVVQRQPFGGWKRSAIGLGSKAGGPNYVNLFRHYENRGPLDIEKATASYRAAWADHFSKDHDPSGLRSESNIFRYRPCRGVILRVGAEDYRLVEALAQVAADICGVKLIISRASDESDIKFSARLPELAKQAEFLRTVVPPSHNVLKAAYTADFNWINAPIASVGRLELTRWLREQTISETRHRYGNLAFVKPHNR